MADLEAIRVVEERGLNAWPGLRTRLVDGWVVRASRGCTGRGNSAHPLRPGALAPAEVAARVATFHRVEGVVPRFRITPLAPPGFEAALEAMGWVEPEPPSRVMVGAIPDLAPEPALVVAPGPEADWIDAITGWEHVALRHRAAFAGIAAAIPAPVAFGTLVVEGEPVARGLAVVEGDHVGLFDLVVAPERRGRGLGRRLVAGLLAWARGEGARAAYLQVATDNARAIRLYRALGLADRYGYRYLVNPDARGPAARR